jgi:hypothetical protein
MASVLNGDNHDLCELVNMPEVHPPRKRRPQSLWEPTPWAMI